MDFLKLVEELNSELYDEHGDTEELYFYTSSGFIDIIGFGDITLWHSEDDMREYIKNDYEPMKPYIKRELKKYGQKLVKLSK